eukprot:131064-Rhodomonas_salina.1
MLVVTIEGILESFTLLRKLSRNFAGNAICFNDKILIVTVSPKDCILIRVTAVQICTTCGAGTPGRGMPVSEVSLFITPHFVKFCTIPTDSSVGLYRVYTNFVPL